MKELTSEQKNLVTENHNLIYDLAKKKNINLDEYYDVLAIGLCKAAITFDIEKSKFSTYAYAVMYNTYKNELRKITSNKYIPKDKLLYLNVSVQSDNSEEMISVYADLMPDNSVDVEKEVINKMIYEDINSKLKSNDQKIFSMLMDGISVTNIAKHMGVSKQFISKKMKRLQKIYYDLDC